MKQPTIPLHSLIDDQPVDMLLRVRTLLYFVQALLKIKCLLSLLMIILPYSAYSGVLGLTHASRANCVNNESISWDAKKAHDLAVTSVHYEVNGDFYSWYWYNTPRHSISTGRRWQTRRAAAVHWGESRPYSDKYYVRGHHWLRINSRRSVYRLTTAKDCNLSAGW